MKISDYIGEVTEYDKKEMLEEKKPKSWLKSVSAFANGIGGVLIFGVADDEELVGVKNSKLAAEKISEFIKTKLDPIPQIILENYIEDGKDFIVLKIPSGVEKPYYYVGEGNRTAYIRVGNESVPATAQHMKQLVLSGSQQTYDSLSSPYPIEKFAFTKLRSVFRKRTGDEVDNSDFLSFGLVNEKGMLTNAGALLADDSPIRQSRLFCTRWHGLDKASGTMDAMDDKEFSGSLIELLQNGEEFVKNNSKKRWKKTATGRDEMPDYPNRAALECIVNGLIHRDYLELGSEVHIDIFDDRMEIYSPGGMYDGSFVQDLDTDKIPSRRRNPIIADMFNRMNYMERRGSGFKKIKSDYKKEINYHESLAPQFYSDNHSFWVTIFNLNYGVSVEGDTKRKLDFDRRKLDFDTGKLDFDTEKLDFEALESCLSEMNVKNVTKNKIRTLYTEFGRETVFSRIEVATILQISITGASDLIKKMHKVGLLKVVVGQGKGKYQFA